MEIIDRLFAIPAMAWLRARAERLWRDLMALRPSVRWGLALAGPLAVAAAIYGVAIAILPVGARYLASGRHFSSEDLTKICRVLDAQHIEYRTDVDQKIAVDSDQYEQAATLVSKLAIGPRSIDEARDQVNGASAWFESPRERERKEQIAREKTIEAMIGKLKGVAFSFVSINRPRAPAWGKAAARPSAFVYVETEGDRQLPFQSIQSIAGFVEGCERDLTMATITIMDHRGHCYLDPANPSLNDLSRNRAREEELSAEMLRQLDWIKGVRVHVRVITPRAPEPVVLRSGRATQPGELARFAGERADQPSAKPDPNGFTPVTAINRSLELEPEPSLAASSGSTSLHATAIGTHPGEPEQGRVLINVPRSYYFNSIINKENHREPTKEELDQMVQRTERRIRSHVDLVVAGSGSWDISVDMITDDLPLARTVVLTSSVDQRRRILETAMIAAAAVLISVLVMIGSRIQAARRPVRVSEPTPATRRYQADTASSPGPSDRVRDLIRRNPEAAASVLQRWTGQGGRVE